VSDHGAQDKLDTLVAVVPVKGLDAAKTRLSGLLSAEERGALALAMAGRVVESLRASGCFARIAVVSPDPRALDWARERDVDALAQASHGLNRGLELARGWAQEEHATALLVALGDLPLLSPDEVRALVDLAAGSSANAQVLLAPDRDEHGTNLLLLRPPSLMPFAFGEGSFARHAAIARSFAGEPLIFRSPGTAFDVDGPLDLAELEARGLWVRPMPPPDGEKLPVEEVVRG
jgi:2-phospho-L-lactate/phosphoenolpyruvate guanylyltransferase